MKLKAIAIFVIIVGSLLPLYILYKVLDKKMRPRESLQRFLLWMFVMLMLVFISTFIIVFSIQMLFPVA